MIGRRVQRPLIAWDTDDPSAIEQMVDYVNQCEADIAELVEALKLSHRNWLGGADLTPDHCEFCALIAKHKGEGDE